MEKQYTPDKQKPVEKKAKIAVAPVAKEEKKEEIKQEKVEETKVEKTETKEEKKEEKKKVEKIKKEKAILDCRDLPISKKHSMAICDYIRGKTIERVIPDLEKVVLVRRPIPMRGEIPHRHGNIMSGRYPVNASKVFIRLLKSLNANASVNGIENAYVSMAVPNDATRPFKRGGSMRFKRTNVYLEAREKQVKENKPKQEITGEKK